MPAQTKTLPVAQLDPVRGNERSATDAEATRRLGESIRTHGLLQRLSVRPSKEGWYSVVAGHRADQASLEEPPCGETEIEEAELEQGNRKAPARPSGS